jgi:ABC-type branched-subunit amino acid transport system substrate-binding protein
MNTATQPLITPPNKPNHSVRTIWILLILGTFCSFGIAILSTPFLLLGLFLGILGTITLLFGAFQHTGFANSFDEFIGNRQKKSNRTERPSQIGKYLRRVLAIMLLSVIILLLLLYIPPLNSTTCQKTILSWSFICGNAFGTITKNVPDALGGLPQVKIGLIAAMSDGPFDTSDQQSNEISIDQKIFDANQLIGHAPYLTLAVVTELSRTSDDPSLSANVGLADLKGAYLFQEFYNSQPANKVKLRLIIGNIGTRLTANNTVPIIMGRIALLAKQDPTFRGILGLPFSGSTKEALNSRSDLTINQIPLIAPSASSDTLANISNFYRIVSSDRTQSCVALDFIVNHLIPALKNTPDHTFKIAIFRDLKDSYSSDLANDLNAVSTGNIPCTSYSNHLDTSNIHTFTEPYTIGQPQQNFQTVIDDAIHQQMDIIFFSGYSYDLKNFETLLNQEQNAQHYPKRIFIVGGDGLYETSGTDNIYNTTYTTIYTPPLAGSATSPDLETYFVTHYRQEFGDADVTTIAPEKRVFPPHALEMYDAANAFTTGFQDPKSLQSQDAFDQLLLNINFYGLTGLAQFNGNQTNNANVGISDPLNKNIYVMCTNKNTTTEEAASYAPAPSPDIKYSLQGQKLLDCNTP